MVLAVGRHSLARERRKPSVALAAILGPAAVFFAAGADVHPFAAERDIEPAVGAIAPAAATAPPCCVEIVAAAPTASSPPPSVDQASMSSAPVRLVSASRWRVASVPRLLPVGLAPERGLQVRTILAARAISAAFPEIHEIGGVRPDPLPWHPNGLAIDVIIPNPGTPLAFRSATRSSRSHSRTRLDSGCRMQSGAASTTRPPARKDMGRATLTTSTSPLPEADTPPAEKPTSADPSR